MMYHGLEYTFIMLRILLLLLILTARAWAVDVADGGAPRLVEAGFSAPPATLNTRIGFSRDALVARCRIAFAAPATANLIRVTAPDGEKLDFVKSDEKVAGADQVFRVLRVKPAWKMLRTQWQIGAAAGKKFRVQVAALPPRELSWMADIYPALTFSTPSGAQGMLDHIWPLNHVTQFYFGLRAPADAPNASIHPLTVRSAGQIVPFQTFETARQTVVKIDGEGDPQPLLPLEFEFAERDFGREPNQISIEVALPDASQIAPDADIVALTGHGEDAVARVYELTNDLDQHFAHAFVSGPTERPLENWTIQSFTAFQGEPKDNWRNRSDAIRLDEGIYFRPDGSLRATDESYGYASDHGTQYRLEVERRREFRQSHRLRVPIARAGETLTFGPDEVGDETVTVRSVRFDPPATAGARGCVTVILEFVPAFREAEFKVLSARLQTLWGENWMPPSTSPYWENGKQERGVFQFNCDIHLAQLSWVEIAFEHLESEAPDKREEIVVRHTPQ